MAAITSQAATNHKAMRQDTFTVVYAELPGSLTVLASILAARR
jgi:hypothetical protein